MIPQQGSKLACQVGNKTALIQSAAIALNIGFSGRYMEKLFPLEMNIAERSKENKEFCTFRCWCFFVMTDLARRMGSEQLFLFSTQKAKLWMWCLCIPEKSWTLWTGFDSDSRFQQIHGTISSVSVFALTLESSVHPRYSISILSKDLKATFVPTALKQASISRKEQHFCSTFCRIKATSWFNSCWTLLIYRSYLRCPLTNQSWNTYRHSAHIKQCRLTVTN